MKIKIDYFATVLIFIIIFICFKNYTPGTYLSGWDTIHPEFNFGEYFSRVLSVWQEHQGLGAPPAQAHAAELPRLLPYYLFSFILPKNFLRYFYFFLTLIIGPLGVYFFVKKYITKFNVIAFLAGLLYLLNLTTVQLYFVPLEMFATLYGLLGWIFLSSLNYFFEGGKKSLIIFSLILFFSVPMAHTPTLFYTFFVLFSLFLFSIYLIYKKNIKRVIILILITLLLNSFWLLPNFYYVKNYGLSVVSTKINEEFSDRALESGINFGDINDTSILKNFLFNWGEYDVNKGYFIYLLEPWQKYTTQTLINILGKVIFISVLLGIGLTIFKKVKIGVAVLVLFILPFFFINNDNFLFQSSSNLLADKFPIIKESLRFPFTKFSNFLLFSFCIFFSIFLNSILNIFKAGSLKVAKLVTLLVFSGVIIVFAWPVFEGNLISKSMEVNIPKQYFDLFSYFNSQDKSGRIVYFPINTFWGWNYYSWGYQGAGFLWFGLKQPLLNREFDRWNPENESLYWELSYAFYSGDKSLLQKVLDKYQVKWILFDKNVIDASSAKSTYQPEFYNLVGSLESIKKTISFGNLDVYQNLRAGDSFVNIKSNLVSSGPSYIRGNLDQAYEDSGDYVSTSQPDYYYPFRSLFTNHFQSEREFKIEETPNSFIFSNLIPKNLYSYSLETKEENILWYDSKNLDRSGAYLPTINYANNLISVTVPKIKNYFAQVISPSQNVKKQDCDFLPLDLSGQIKNINTSVLNINQNTILRISSTLSDNCSAQFQLPNLAHQFSYLITVKNRNIAGKSLMFWLENLNSKRIDQEAYLPINNQLHTDFFIQPSMEQYGQGYTLHFDNWSYNKHPSINDLGEIEVYPIPYDFLTGLYFKKPELLTGIEDNGSVDVYHPLNYFYKVKIKSVGQYLTLAQAYDTGWVAFSGIKFLPHIKINNWENGWQLSSEDKEVIIFFWPQLLEWFGFILLGLLIFYLLKFYPKRYK